MIACGVSLRTIAQLTGTLAFAAQVFTALRPLFWLLIELGAVEASWGLGADVAGLRASAEQSAGEGRAGMAAGAQ